MFRTEEEKKVWEKKFKQIVTGYETLREDDSRSEYDYILEHSEEMCHIY